jgi:hypothetical protein
MCISKRGLAILTLTCLSCCHGSGRLPENDWIEIRVDPTVELFCTIHRLAGTGQDATNELPRYIREIEDHFDPFRTHRAVELARQLWETHKINISALTTLLVYFDAPPGLSARNVLDPLPPELDSRWTADVIPEFIDAAREFARDTDFMEFFELHRPLFDRSVGNLSESLRSEDMLAWYRSYFGYVPDNYTIIVGMQTGFGNYGASMTGSDGGSEFYSIIGAHSPFLWSGIPRFSTSRLIPIVVHEFSHPYVNPLIAKHRELLEGPGEIMYPYHKANLTRYGTLSWHGMMNEYLVRACVIRYFHSKNDRRAVDRQIRRDEEQGYVGVRALADFLEEYEENRDEYPTLDSFMPQIAVFFEQYATSLRGGG